MDQTVDIYFSRQYNRNEDFDFGRTSYQAVNNRDTSFERRRNMPSNQFKIYRPVDNDDDCWGESKNHYLGTTSYQGCVNWTSPKVSINRENDKSTFKNTNYLWEKFCTQFGEDNCPEFNTNQIRNQHYARNKAWFSVVIFV